VQIASQNGRYASGIEIQMQGNVRCGTLLKHIFHQEGQRVLAPGIKVLGATNAPFGVRLAIRFVARELMRVQTLDPLPLLGIPGPIWVADITDSTGKDSLHFGLARDSLDRLASDAVVTLTTTLAKVRATYDLVAEGTTGKREQVALGVDAVAELVVSFRTFGAADIQSMLGTDGSRNCGASHNITGTGTLHKD
jgi:hypothetical protein